MGELKKKLKKYIIDSLSGIQLDVIGAECLLEKHKLTYKETKKYDYIVVNLLNMDPNHFESSKNNCINSIKEILKKQESSSSADSDDSASENSDDEDLNQKEEIEILIPIYKNNHYCTCSLKFVRGEKITYEIIDLKDIYNNEGLGKQIIEELQSNEELNELFQQYSKGKKDIIFESSTEYSKRISQKQYDNTSCGYYVVATINDIVYKENMGVISENEVKKQIEPSKEKDKKIQKEVLKYLDIENLIKFYGNCVEKGKTKTQPDLDFLFEMVNNENIQDNCYNITINDNEYSIISLNGNQYFVGEDNKIYKLILDKENIEFEELFKCNEEVINYINKIYFNSELKKTNIESLNQIKKEDFYKEFVYSVIKNNFNDDEIKKGIIKAIPKNMRIEFLKEFGKEKKDNENSINENSILNNLAKILNINIEQDGIDKIVDTITLMCYDLNREDIKEIFEIKDDNNFYEEFYNAKNNQEYKKEFVYYCISKSNNIEVIKSELINNFDNFIDGENNINEEEYRYDNIKDHKLEDTEDLKKILNDIEFKKEFKAKNPNKSILDIYNYYNKLEYIIKPKNIELSINDFYFGDNYQYNTNLLLNNNNLVIVDAGNTEGTFSGSGSNGACREAYNLDSKVEIFKLEEGEEKNSIKCLKQIEKDVCSILEITKNKQTYKMIYLTGPVLSGNNDIKNLDNALNAYLRALQDENLNDMTVLFSGISNNYYAGNYKTYINNYNGNSFNIVEFYTALYFKIHSSDLEKKKCNIIYTNGISHAMDYIDNVLKVNENKISIYEILNGFSNKNNDIIYTEIEDMLKKSNFTGIDYTKQVNIETNIPLMENFDIHIGKAQREIIDSIRSETKDNSFDILTLVNLNNNRGEIKTLLDLEKECYTVIKECDTAIKKQTDLYIIANMINETIKKEKAIKQEDVNIVEVLDISCKEVLNNEQYKKNHSSMRCNNVKFDRQSLSFHISHGGCRDANIKFNVPQGFSKEQVFILIGCYGLNSVIKTFNKDGNCEIDYNGNKYNNVSEIESDNILKKSFEFAEQSKLEDLQNALNDFEEIGIGQSTTQIAF